MLSLAPQSVADDSPCTVGLGLHSPHLLLCGGKLSLLLSYLLTERGVFLGESDHVRLEPTDTLLEGRDALFILEVALASGDLLTLGRRETFLCFTK